MAEIKWEKKKGASEKKLEKVIEYVERDKTAPAIEDSVVIGFNAGQFFVRFPRELSNYMCLDPQEAQNKKYRFKVKLDTTKYEPTDIKFEGTFEVTKNA